MRDIDLIVVHHSASPLTTTAADIAVWHAARFKLGTGYHRIIEADGKVLDGRKVQRAGAHAKGSNTSSLGICVVGDNTKAGSHWTPRENISLRWLLTYLTTSHANARIVGHRDTPGAATECPGLDIKVWCKHNGLGERAGYL